MTEQTPPKNESKYKEFLWRKLIWSRLKNITHFFPAWLNMVNTTAADYAVDKGIGASRYNVGIISAMASQITNLTIVI